jgi:hypothetical protein
VFDCVLGRSCVRDDLAIFASVFTGDEANVGLLTAKARCAHIAIIRAHATNVRDRLKAAVHLCGEQRAEQTLIENSGRIALVVDRSCSVSSGCVLRPMPFPSIPTAP